MARRLEASHQEAFFQWLKLYPEIDALTWHTPNGGRRNVLEARAFKRMGVKSGVPDVFIAIPSNMAIYYGLFIEFKSKNGKLTQAQSKMIDRLDSAGYKVVVCYDWHEARELVMSYLKGTKYVQLRPVQGDHTQTRAKRASALFPSC